MSRFWASSFRQRALDSHRARRDSRRKARRIGKPTRLGLETLEERRLLATFNVTNLNDSGGGSLRQAVIDANSTGGADDIVFQAGLNGTIALTSGEMPITESLTITGNGAANSVIDAQQASRIFNITGGDVTLNDLTLTNGRITSGSPARGGAILLLAATGSLEVNRSVLSNNFAPQGGAIESIQGDVVVTDSTLMGNSSQIHGGAISSAFPVTITNSTLSENSSVFGGAIDGDFVTIRGSTFHQNSASTGGALHVNDLIIENSTLSNNTADVDGGAIYVEGQALITQTTFFLNTAARGGAIYAMDGPLDVLQSTLDSNISHSIMTSTFSGNGIFSESAPVTIRNSIVASLNAGGRSDVQPSSDPGDAFVVEYSLIGTNIGTTLTPTGETTPDANGNLIGDSAGIVPGIVPLADNGGPTMTSALQPDSPALNRGSNSIASSITSDQRGAPFARVFGGTVDMGAFELQDVTVVVDTNVDEDDGDYSTGDLSLREAVRLTSANPGADTITFAPSTNGTDFDLTLGLMTITDTLTITGNGAANTVIDAQHSSAIFEVFPLPMTAPDLNVQGISLVNGLSAGQHSAINSLSTGTLTMSDSVVSGNTGGAIGHQGALNVTRSTFTGNSGAHSVGVNSGAAISAHGAITVIESTLSGNTDGASGGAIGGGSGDITVIQSTLAGNTAWQGGAIYGGSGTITVVQSTLTDNTATGFFEVSPAAGGGIYGSSAPVTIRNSIVAGNMDGGTSPDVRPSPDAGDPFVVEYSLIGQNTGTGLTATGPTTPDANGNLIGDATGIAPLLAPLADNGGPTQTRALLTGSPAFNSGSNAIAAPFTFDQRGMPFARVLAGIVDMGAYEATTADLQVTKTGAAHVSPGQDLTYTITVSNTGPADSQDVLVSDLLPAGTTYVSLAQDNGPSFSVNAPPVGSHGTVELSASVLASGASASFTLVVNVGAGGASSLSNTVQVSSSTLDPNAANNASTVDTSAFRVIDNGDPAPAYTESGDLGYPWTNQGFLGDVREMISDGKSVTYTFDGLTPGDIYDISTTWTEFLNRESQAPYTINGATVSPVTVLVDQTQAPNDFSDVGSWERLGTFEVDSGGSLVVTLAGTPNQRSVIADAIRIDLRTDAEIVVTADGSNIETGVGTVDVGSGLLGATVTKQFTVRNIGAADLTLDPLTLSPGSAFDIVQSYSPSATIMPGQTATFVIGLKTASTGSKSDTLTFGNNDANENPFSIALSGAVAQSVAIIDDGDPVGYGDTGSPARWTQQGFIGTDGASDVHEAVQGGTAQSATYTFPGLPAGTYRVSATWTPFYNRATNVPYTINGGAPILVNQKLSPSSTSSTSAGSVLQDPGSHIYFADLDGTFSFAGGTLTVAVSDNGANGNVIFDAVRVELLAPLQVEGIDAGPASAPLGKPTDVGLAGTAVDKALASAIEYWSAHDPQAAATLANVQVIVKDLPQNILGLGSFSTPTIWLDDDAAGYGWSAAAVGGLTAVHGMDLLSVVTHELGHVLGHPDLDPRSHADHVMGGTLRSGMRRVTGQESVVPVRSLALFASEASSNMDDLWYASDDNDSTLLSTLISRRSAAAELVACASPQSHASSHVPKGPIAIADEASNRLAWHRWDQEKLLAIDECFAEIVTETQS